MIRRDFLGSMLGTFIGGAPFVAKECYVDEPELSPAMLKLKGFYEIMFSKDPARIVDAFITTANDGLRIMAPTPLTFERDFHSGSFQIKTPGVKVSRAVTYTGIGICFKRDRRLISQSRFAVSCSMHPGDELVVTYRMTM